MERASHPEILSKAAEMEKAGLTPNLFETNAMIMGNGRPFFLEIEDMDLGKVRERAKTLPDTRRAKLEKILKRYEFEKGLDDVDLAMYLGSGEDRKELLRRMRAKTGKR